MLDGLERVILGNIPFALTVLRGLNKIRRCKSLIILAYHRICEKENLFYHDTISASPDEFCKQMKYIKKRFNVVSCRELIDYIQNQKKLKPNSLMITFDDGYKDFVINAFPILDKYQIPATVFITTGYLGGDYISWEDRIAYIFNELKRKKINLNELGMYYLNSDAEKEISGKKCCKLMQSLSPAARKRVVKELIEKYHIDEHKMFSLAKKLKKGFMAEEDIKYLHKKGIEFGCHTVSHPKLTTLGTNDMFSEISVAKNKIENILGTTINCFAYPYGHREDFNKAAKYILRRLNFKCAFTIERGNNDLRNLDVFEIDRIGIAPNSEFKLYCHGYC